MCALSTVPLEQAWAAADLCLRIDTYLEKKFGLTVTERREIIDLMASRPRQEIVQFREDLRTIFSGQVAKGTHLLDGDLFHGLKLLPREEIIDIVRVLASNDRKTLLRRAAQGVRLSVTEKRAIVLLMGASAGVARRIKEAKAARTWLSRVSLDATLKWMFEKHGNSPAGEVALVELMVLKDGDMPKPGKLRAMFSRHYELRRLVETLNEFLPGDVDLVSEGLNRRISKIRELLRTARGATRYELELQMVEAQELRLLILEKAKVWESDLSYLSQRLDQPWRRWAFQRLLPKVGPGASKLFLLGVVLPLAALTTGVVARPAISEVVERIYLNAPLPSVFEQIERPIDVNTLPPAEQGTRWELEILMKKLSEGTITQDEYLREVERLQREHPELFPE